MRMSQSSHGGMGSAVQRLRPKHLIRHVALAAAAGSLVAGMVYAVTTISTNIVTDGTLSVTGRATTTASLVVGATQPAGFDLAAGDLLVGAEATTTGNLGIGQGSASNDDSLYFDAASAEFLSWLDTRGEFSLSDDLIINGNASTTGYFVVGTNSPTSNLAAGSLWVGGTASSTNLVVSGRATTTGNLVVGSSNQVANSTTTITIGSYDGTSSTQGSCLKFRQNTGFIWCYIGGTSGTSLVCSTTVSCE